MKTEEKIAKLLAKKDNKLLLDIENDEKLSEERKSDFQVLAAALLSDFEQNIDKTSIELNDIHPYGIDNWYAFLTYPCVKSYIEAFKNEKMILRAERGILDGESSALKIKETISNRSKTDNSNFIIVRVPEKIDFKEDL